MEASEASGPEIGGGAEERLVQALRSGEEAAFLELVNLHHGSMLRVASGYVKSRASAEEVVQEAWLGVLRGLHLFEGRCSLRSWIFQILVNCARTRGVRDGRAIPMSALAGADDEAELVPAQRFRDGEHRWAGHWADAPEPWPDARVESGELLALVQDALETLPESQRTVMSLRDVEGWDSDEVCDLLRISEANQRVLLHRARSKVRAYLEAKWTPGITPDVAIWRANVGAPPPPRRSRSSIAPYAPRS